MGMTTQNDFSWPAGCDKAKFTGLYTSTFASVSKFNRPSIPDLLFVLTKLQEDKRVLDLRWAAYMLATVFIETSHTIRLREAPSGKPKHPKPRITKAWRNFTPVEEAGHGKGRAYFRPVKVKRLPNGDARVTEWDGDQWIVPGTGGRPIPQSPSAARGLQDVEGPANVRYTSDDGPANQYFGRGYVQLTWWDNYLAAGVAIGRGLAFLYEPDQLIKPDLAYEVMALGMTTGKGFANGRRLSQYIAGGHADYVHARDMANPGAPMANKREVADIATLFEKALVASRTAG